MPRLLLADDHQVVREALRTLLESNGLAVVGEAADGLTAVSMARSLRPDVVVLDLMMPGLNGIDAGRTITQETPRTRCVLLTMHAEEQYVLAAMRGNISGYALKTRAGSDLVQAIQEVCAGHTYLSPGIAHTIVDAMVAQRDAPPDPLTLRERQVLQLIAESKTTKEAAAVLGVSTKTAETHRAHLMAKLDIHDTAGLVRYAIRNGVIVA